MLKFALESPLIVIMGRVTVVCSILSVLPAYMWQHKSYMLMYSIMNIK